jgi:nicotinamidase-related amidase/alkylated DNA repair dioxygenase AlkB
VVKHSYWKRSDYQLPVRLSGLHGFNVYLFTATCDIRYTHTLKFTDQIQSAMLFAMGSLPKAPRLETRKALLLVDLQNDFLQEDGKLFVKNAKEFLPKLPSLVTKFREKGEVFWVQTEFQETRNTICPDLQSYLIVLEEFLDAAKSSAANTCYEGDQPEHDPKHSTKSCGEDDPEAFLAQRSKTDWPRCCLPNTFGFDVPKTIASVIHQKRDSRIMKTDYSAFQTKSLLPTLRMKLITQLYLCGSLSNISVYATALDAVRHGLAVTIIEDCVGYRSAKCHEEAMRQMADSMGANGIDYQELMDDLHGNLGDVVTTSTFNSTIGTRQIGRDDSPETYTMRVKIKRWMDDLNEGRPVEGDGCGSEGNDGFKAGSAKRRSLNRNTGLSASSARRPESRPPSANASQKRSSDKVDSEELVPRPSPNAKANRIRMRRPRVTTDVASQDSASQPSATATMDKAASQEPPVIQPSPSSVAAIEADSDPDGSASLQVEMSSLVDKAKSIGRTLRGAKYSRESSSSTPFKVLGPGDFIGERDSRIIYDFLPAEKNVDDAFARLSNDTESCEVRWQEMYHRSGKVPRLVAVQGATIADGSIPIYRHPADESPPLLPFSPTVQSIREEVEKTVGHPVNHVLIQLYRGGEDNISEHSDKTLDIVRGSFIVNVSLGARRTMTLRMKKSASVTPALDQPRRTSAPTSSPHSPTDVKRTAQRIPLPHNSLFILGQDTNQIWLHAIRADKRLASEKSAEELAFNEERISLTFRQIGTFINPKDETIWGQGATSKSVEVARVVLKGQDAEKEGERLIRAFSQENHQSHDFDWVAQYGAGFDVVNFTTKEDAVNTG